MAKRKRTYDPEYGYRSDYANKYGTTTHEQELPADQSGGIGLVRRLETDGRRAAVKTQRQGKATSVYTSKSDGAMAQGSIRDGKTLAQAKAQLRRIEKASNGGERHARLVEKARKAVEAYSVYKALGANAG